MGKCNLRHARDLRGDAVASERRVPVRKADRRRVRRRLQGVLRVVPGLPGSALRLRTDLPPVRTTRSPPGRRPGQRRSALSRRNERTHASLMPPTDSGPPRVEAAAINERSAIRLGITGLTACVHRSARHGCWTRPTARVVRLARISLNVTSSGRGGGSGRGKRRYAGEVGGGRDGHRSRGLRCEVDGFRGSVRHDGHDVEQRRQRRLAIPATGAAAGRGPSRAAAHRTMVTRPCRDSTCKRRRSNPANSTRPSSVGSRPWLGQPSAGSPRRLGRVAGCACEVPELVRSRLAL